MGDMEQGDGRRVRGGGGGARRAERTAVSFETARFIERNIPNFEILNEEALAIIEWNAETILEEIGVNEDATSLSIGVQLDYKVIHRLTVEYADSFSKRHTLNDVAVSGNGNYGVTDRGRVMVTYKVAF